MIKRFCILLAVLSIAPIFLCSCDDKPQDKNFMKIENRGVSNMIERVQTETGASNQKVLSSYQKKTSSGKTSARKPRAQEGTRVTRSGVVYIKDENVVNKTDRADTGFAVGPSDVKFHTGDIRLQY